jgi:hypothetical protein
MAVGQVRLAIPALAGASFRADQDLRVAEVRGAFAKGDAALATRAWVDANCNLVCIELCNKGSVPLTISTNIIKGCGSPLPPVSIQDTGSSFLYDPDASVPGSRKLGLATRIIGGSAARSFTLERGEAATLVTAILTDLEVPGKDPLGEARALVDGITPDKLATLTAAHRQWWNDFWSRSFVEIPDKVIEQSWYSSWYIMASCSRAGKVAPGLWGNWITTDNPGWHGDFHLNYNFQAPFYGLYSSNHVETTLPFYDAMNQSIPRGQRIARERGWKGIHLPVSIGPWGMCPEGDAADWGQRSNTAYAALLFIWHWQHTRDLGWLRDSGYAFPRATAEFWENYLKLENGRYVITNDSIHEGSGPDMNALLSLGLVRTLFANLIPMSEALNVDGDRRGMYEHHALPNKLLNFGGGGIENVSPLLAVTEMLLQSHDGVLRVFPCWPAGLDARFGTLRAVGAFLVSAELKAGEICGVRILSERGNACTIVNPWPERSMRVARSSGTTQTLQGRRFTLDTTAGETLDLRPE